MSGGQWEDCCGGIEVSADFVMFGVWELCRGLDGSCRLDDSLGIFSELIYRDAN